MDIEEPIMHRATRAAVSAFRLGLTGLRTFSGLGIILAVGVLVVTSQGSAGSPPDGVTETGLPSRLASGPYAWTPVTVFYLVDSEAQAHLAAAEEYEVWAETSSLGLEASIRRVSYLVTRTQADEAEAYAMIVQEIRNANTPSIVAVIDKRTQAN